MTAEGPLAVALKFLDRLGAQDADGIKALFAADIDWLVPGGETVPWTGRRSRREEIGDYFRTMWPVFVPGKSKVEFERPVIDGEDVMLLGTFTHTVAANGIEFTTPSAMHLVIHDGEIVRMHLYEDTLTVERALAAGSPHD
jgi:uncharacterized protein